MRGFGCELLFDRFGVGGEDELRVDSDARVVWEVLWGELIEER